MSDIFVFAEIKCKPENVPHVREILLNLQSETKKEEGCIFYEVLQLQNEPTTFSTMEHWKNSEVEAKHWQTPHLLNAAEQLQEYLLSDMVLNKYSRS